MTTNKFPLINQLVTDALKEHCCTDIRRLKDRLLNARGRAAINCVDQGYETVEEAEAFLSSAEEYRANLIAELETLNK